MTNECNILIYSVFIFFCYSFIILNMALPLFHIGNAEMSAGFQNSPDLFENAVFPR